MPYRDSSPTSVCSRHATAAAHTACGRCGVKLCEPCATFDDLVTLCAGCTALHRRGRMRWRATVAGGALGLFALFFVGMGYAARVAAEDRYASLVRDELQVIDQLVVEGKALSALRHVEILSWQIDHPELKALSARTRQLVDAEASVAKQRERQLVDAALKPSPKQIEQRCGVRAERL